MKDRPWRLMRRYPYRLVKGKKVKCFKGIALDPEKSLFRMTSRREI